MFAGEGFQILNNIITYILNPAVRLLFAAGFLLFLWGLFVFLSNLESVGKNKDDRNKRQEGLQHLKWGLIGMFIMIAVNGIIGLVVNTFELNVPQYRGGSTSAPANSGDSLLGPR